MGDDIQKKLFTLELQRCDRAYQQAVEFDNKYPEHEQYNKIVLLVDYYESKSLARNNEIVSAITNNINNREIDEIHVFEQTGSVARFDSDKIIIYPDRSRSTYKCMIDHVREVGEKDPSYADNTVYLLCNNDCYFDDTLRILKYIDYRDGKRVVSMTRVDQLADGSITRPERTDGQRGYWGPESSDAWAFTYKLTDTKADLTGIELGRIHCENRFLSRLYRSGHDVFNVGFCQHVKCIHIHNTQYRDDETRKCVTDDFEHHPPYFDYTSKTPDWSKFIIDSGMMWHPSNFYFDEQSDREYGAHVVRDIVTLFKDGIE